MAGPVAVGHASASASASASYSPVMVKRAVTTFTDDLDGSDATSTMFFALSGVVYEIDLSDANAVRLEQALAPFIRAARRTTRTGATQGTNTDTLGQPPRDRRTSQEQVRDWATAHGHPVGARGRIAQSVRDAYNVAH